MAGDAFNTIRQLAKDTKNPNRQLEALKYAAARARAPFDRDTWLNCAFYVGEQYVDWNPASMAIEPIPRKTQNAPRPIANKIMHFVAQSHATALQDKPTVDVLPATDGPVDISNASVAQAYLTYLSEPSVAGFDKKLSEAVLWALLAGDGYLKWVYNPRLKRPDIVACSPLDIYSDPYATSFENSRYVIHSQFMDTEQVYDFWGKEVKPTEADPARVRYLQQIGFAPVLSGVQVNELWMKPSRRYPNGLYAAWTAREQLVAPTDFPYEHKRLPFTQLGVIPIPGSQHYASAVKFLRPAQMELNKYHAQKIMVREAFANPKWWLPSELELEVDPDDSPNQILRGNSNNGTAKPELIQAAPMPDNGDGDWLRQEMMDTVGLHEVSQAQVPGRVEAAKAIDMLKEADVSRLSVLNDTTRAAISEGFWQLLQLARQYVRDEVIVQTYSTEGLPEVRRMKTDIIKPGMRVRVTMGTGLARSRAARQDQLLLYWQNGIITDPDRIAQLLDMPAPSFNESNVFDMRLARNENLVMADGTPITPNSWDNHELHLREHNNYRKTHDYQMLEQETKQMFEFHCDTHEKLQVEQLSKEIRKQALAQQIAAGGQAPAQQPASAAPAGGGGGDAAQRYGPQGPEPGWQVQQAGGQ